MDYLVAILVSLIVPGTLSYSGVDYNPRLGVLFARTEDYNRVDVESINENSEEEITIITLSTGEKLSFSYEFILGYKIPVSTNFWMMPRITWNPSVQNIDINYETSLLINPRARSFYYNERPAVGGLVGWDIFEYDINRAIPLGLAMHGGVSLLQVTYSDLDNYGLSMNFNNAIQYRLGISLVLGEGWHMVGEGVHFSTKFTSVEEQELDILFRRTEFKLGFVYEVENQVISRDKQNQEYEDIIKSLSPSIEAQIEKAQKAQADTPVEQEQVYQEEDPSPEVDQ